MRQKILRSLALTALVSVVLATLLIAFVYYEDYDRRMENDLAQSLHFLAAGAEAGGVDFLASVKGQTDRITLISSDGAVLFDSRADPGTMGNHGDRPEFIAALSLGQGEATRVSGTLLQKTYYQALRLGDGSVLRLGTETDTVINALIGLLPTMAVAGALAFFLAAWLSRYLARRIVAPFNRIDLDHPEDSPVYDELSPLLTRIVEQKKTIDLQMEDLERRKREFAALTDNMSEGLLILDPATRVLSFNRAALSLLSADPPPEGATVFSLNRSEVFRAAVEDALSGRHSQRVLALPRRSCQVFASPVFERGALFGVTVLLLDVTEREEREALRREFTANVSHELKTPLTSISGAAELLKNNMVAEQDIPHFAETIYNEAARLISLITDIIDLSRLDEGKTPEEMAPTDLYQVAEGVYRRLKPIAEERGLAFSLAGSSAVILGSPVLLEELVANLCDNAIKYNRPGGSIRLSVEGMPDHRVCLTVADTGIGIPPEARDRVFERFYRVDKSRSKDEGGTGLGLSIVKHVAERTGGAITLTSALGEGTAVRILWDAAR